MPNIWHKGINNYIQQSQQWSINVPETNAKLIGIVLVTAFLLSLIHI